ncbi:MAG: tetratricopeptide repeat protein, partial [Fimbriimonadales bacterium]|nr:tetratricopeptide repeat protein [Fimbriimonadales bacterium]
REQPGLLVALGQLREREGRWAEALEALKQAERLAQNAGAIAGLTQVYRWQAWVHLRQDHYNESIALCRQALAILPAENEQEVAAVYNILASCYGNLGDLEQQQQYHRRALELCRRLGDRRREAMILHNMATYYLAQGLMQETVETEQTSLRILEELNSYSVCFPLITLGQTYLQCGDLDKARDVLERLLRLTDAFQDMYRRGYALFLLGHLYREQGNAAAARACYDEAWPIAEQTQDNFMCFELYQGQARLALDAGDLREARRQANLALCRVRPLPDCQLEGRALATLAHSLDVSGNTQQAESHYVQALRLVEKASARLDQAIICLRLADLYRRDGREQEAQIHLEQALALSQEHGYDFIFTRQEQSRALPLLLKALEVCQTSQVSEIERLLTLIGAPAVEPLITLLDTADDTVRTRIVWVLGEIGDERAIPALSHLRRNRHLQETVRAALERIIAAPRPPLRVLALGDFQVWRGDASISPQIWLSRRKARLLLLYLLSRAPRPVTCDELLEALWPDLAPDSARRALNTTFSDLRHILEPYLGQGQPSCYLARDGEALTFTGEAWYDVTEFQRAVESGDQAARRALELYRGDFLPEEPFADWALRERERLRTLYLNTLVACLEEHVQAGRWREGVELARHILAQEPWLEEVWRALMLCLARLGRRSEALRAYQDCVRALQQELDAVPSVETQALYNTLKQT